MILTITGERETTQGADFQLEMRVIDEPSKLPHNFQGFDGATAFFGNKDTTDGIGPVAVTGTNPETNKLAFAVMAADTTNLAVGEAIDFEVHFKDDSGTRIEQCQGQLKVNEQLF